MDKTRIYGEIARQILLYRDSKTNAGCHWFIPWEELKIHYIQELQIGGWTLLEYAVPVHKSSHPKEKNQNCLKKDGMIVTEIMCRRINFFT